MKQKKMIHFKTAYPAQKAVILFIYFNNKKKNTHFKTADLVTTRK